MKKNQNVQEFKLIDGQFHSDDAKNVLLSLFNSKISYHQLESFSNHIRHGSDVAISQNRIESLKESIENIKIILEEANANRKQLKIDSLIQISFVE